MKLIIVAALSALLFIAIGLAQAERNSSWTYEVCYTNSCIKSRLDSLPLDRARAAKLTTWNNNTYVWYQE